MTRQSSLPRMSMPISIFDASSVWVAIIYCDCGTVVCCRMLKTYWLNGRTSFPVIFASYKLPRCKCKTPIAVPIKLLGISCCCLLEVDRQLWSRSVAPPRQAQEIRLVPGQPVTNLRVKTFIVRLITSAGGLQRPLRDNALLCAENKLADARCTSHCHGPNASL